MMTFSYPASGLLMAATLIMTGALAGPVSNASAQSGDEDRARVLFQNGNAALREGRLNEGAQLLQESFSLSPNVSNAFNLAVARRRLGETQRAIALLDEVLAGEFGELDAERSGTVRDERASAQGEMAVVVVTVDRNVATTVEVDDVPVGEVDGGALTLELDPREHSIAALAEEFHPETRIIRLGRGDHRTLRFELRPRSVDGSAETTDSDGSFPWGWVLLTAALVVGAGVAAFFLIPREADPIVDPVTGIGETLVWPYM